MATKTSSKSTDNLLWLQELGKQAKELHSQQEAAIQTIRAGFVERVIVFMDVVGSTAFKVRYSTTPEQWILRVQQFSTLLASAVQNSKGRVVKFIGDEVMASFENVHDAQNLVGRISEVEDNLKNATGFETRIKVAVDIGSVYELRFLGHEAPDPQGTPVDRCARIAKFGLPGEVLSSATFAEKTPQLSWKKVGTVELKGLGRNTIYQLGRATADIEPKIELRVKDHDAMTEELTELKTTNARLMSQNNQLQRQLEGAGQQPDPDACAQDEEDEDAEAAWAPVERSLEGLRKLINGAPGLASTYARFLFLHHASKGPEQYNKFEGRVFDELIEASLVHELENGYYQINEEHPRNQKALAKIEDAQRLLDEYLLSHEADADDLFNWSLSDAGFWEAHAGLTVV